MLVGGAMVNALAFSGSNWLFSMLRSSGLDEERKRHDKAVEQLQAAQAEWSQKRTERLDWISEDLHRQPKLSDFYVPSSGQRDREIAFVVLGMAATGIIAYKLAK